jgi:mRNA interferase RelE/StbE
MKVLIDKSFGKDIQEINDLKLKAKIADVIDEIIIIERISEIKNIKKLKGDSISYRIRIGDYRIGLEYVDNCIKLIRLLHRKDIYKSFP